MKQITIDGVDYDIDTEKAKMLGIIKPVGRQLKSGDMYQYGEDGETVLVIKTGYNRDNFITLGAHRELTPYNSVNDNKTAVAMEKYLRDTGYIFIKNVTFKNIH